jgi:hypothetical protein
MNKKYYVYAHFINDQTDIPFYIGKGTGGRGYSRIGRNSEWITESTNGFVVKIIKDNITELEAFDLEIDLITKYGRRDINTGYLVNKTSGGSKVNSDKPMPVKLEEFIKNYMFKNALKDILTHGVFV